MNTSSISTPPIRHKRQITGISAILLPFKAGVDWKGFEAHTRRTKKCGLMPAINMDTGYANLIGPAVREEALSRASSIAGEHGFVAGAFIGDKPGDRWDPRKYEKQVKLITRYGGVPVIFQSYGLIHQTGKAIVSAYRQIADMCDSFIGFELGKMFMPFGTIYDADTFRGIMQIKQCIGCKHSSLRRESEWERLAIRDRERPDFKVFTGNDLAVDMVMYGSDYLLGLSTFAPDAFALRDSYWKCGDNRFYELNDVLQYLGFFSFRAPVPAYKHSAAQFLKLRGWIESNNTHPRARKRPASDIPILAGILSMLEEKMS
ncbi:MAG: dihydrodipicolinate synthase family protein [bacterium]